MNFRNEHLNTNTIAFNNTKLIRERQFHEQQVREQKARELREHQAHLHHYLNFYSLCGKRTRVASRREAMP